MLSPYISVLLFLLLSSGLFVGVYVWQRRGNLDPEVARKMFHIGSGLLVLPFPWLFKSALPVILLGAISISALIFLRIFRRGDTGLSGVLQSVGRKSLGEIYFAISVCILFVLSDGQPLFYCLPILILTFADAFAALVGVRSGRRFYSTSGGWKTAEGSIAFLITSMIIVFIPVFLQTEHRLLDSFLLALIIGLIATALEAFALKGRDNLFLPLGVYTLLKVYIDLDSISLMVRLAVLLVLLLIVFLWRNRTALDDAALLGASLSAYVCWAVGGWSWLVPPVILLLTYTAVFPNPHGGKRGAHDIHAVATITGFGLLCLLFQAARPGPIWRYMFSVSYAAQLSMIGIASLACRSPRIPALNFLSRAIILSWLLVFIPYYAIEYWTGGGPLESILALPGIAAAALLFFFLQPQIDSCPATWSRWIRQGAFGAIGTMVSCLPVIYAGGGG